MIQFGKSYYYAKEKKIVYPIVIDDEKIICNDRKGNTFVVLKAKDLVSTEKIPKAIIAPSYIPNVKKPTVITKSTTENKEETKTTEPAVITEPAKTVEPKTVEPIVVPVITKNEEPELVITRMTVMPPPDTSLLSKKGKVIVEEYI